MQAAFAILGGAPSGWRPVSGLLAHAVAPFGIPVGAGESFFYWTHVTAILCFLIYIPRSKHRHMFLAAPNVYLRSLAPRGLSPEPPAPPKPDSLVDSGFDRKQILDLLACTECGRCRRSARLMRRVCRSAPRRSSWTFAMRFRWTGALTSFPGGAISDATLWACTTCHACMEACPVHIEHVPKIIQLRRHAIEEDRIPRGVQDALSNIGRSGNSMGKPAKMRARWTKDLPFRVKDARAGPVDVLWFVGDHASCDPRAVEVSRRLATLLHTAGVDFGILYEAEQNSGNDVRRCGEEGLFGSLAQSNIAALEGCSFRRVLTTDPHALNALRNEYRSFGVSFDVVHHTALLAELLDAGRSRRSPTEQFAPPITIPAISVATTANSTRLGVSSRRRVINSSRWDGPARIPSAAARGAKFGRRRGRPRAPEREPDQRSPRTGRHLYLRRRVSERQGHVLGCC